MHIFLRSFFSGRVSAMQTLWFLSTTMSWDKKLAMLTLTNPRWTKLLRYQLKKMNFFPLLDKTVLIHFAIQLRNITKWRDEIRHLLSGISWSSSKSLLLSEVRRIMPTAAGLPLELSLFTAAVAAAKATGGQRPPLLTWDLLEKKKCYYVQE